jgi:hypothetical protein
MSEPLWCPIRQHYCRCQDFGKRCDDFDDERDQLNDAAMKFMEAMAETPAAGGSPKEEK